MKKKRKVFRLIHLYVGAIAGFIVFVEAVTGAMWVFKDEIESLTTREIIIENIQDEFISTTMAKESALAALPDRAIHGILYPNKTNKPIEVIFYEAEPLFYQSLYLDPNSGSVLKQVDHTKGFFAFVLDGHMNLWLPPKIGSPMVAYGTLLFLFSIITGVILWWPKNKKGRKQRFRFDWKKTTRWRRKNFDLHTIVGFYLSAFAMIFVITGLVMGLNWFYFIYYKGIGGDSEMRFVIPNNLPNQHEDLVIDKPIDKLPSLLKKQYPNAQDFEIHLPYADSVSIYVEVSYKDGVYYDSDYLFFDQHTLAEVATPSIYGKYQEADMQDHLMRANYDIHVGAIGGLPTKVLMFICCVTIASLPITGGFVWYGRVKKSKD